MDRLEEWLSAGAAGLRQWMPEPGSGGRAEG